MPYDCRFSVLWALLITYGVGMIFKVAYALNEPFGNAIQDIRLNRMCAKISHDVLCTFASSNLELDQVIDAHHETPTWLEHPIEEQEKMAPLKNAHSFSVKSVLNALSRFQFRPMSFNVFLGFVAFTVWTSFIIFLTWGLSRNDYREHGVRWWFVYVPFSTDASGYVSLGVFLLLAFWMNDAYGRYWRGLQIWPTTILSLLENLAFKVSISCKHGSLHHRDHERLLSHIAALPIASKLTLRDSRDLSELEGILSQKDICAFSEAHNLLAHSLDVVTGYIISLDTPKGNRIEVKDGPRPPSLITFVHQLWEVEEAFMECIRLRSFPLSPAFTTHLQLFVTLWLALLPLSMVIHDGFLAFAYLLPIGYAIINLLGIGQELLDPFGYDKHDIPLDEFCDELKRKIHNVYSETRGGVSKFVHDTGYDRRYFDPKGALPYTSLNSADTDERSGSVGDGYVNTASHKLHDHLETPTMKGSIRLFLGMFPSVSPLSQLCVTLWSVAAVFASRGFAYLWEDDQRFAKECGKWCSPVDVNGSVLANVGFALFLILAFRAFDGISRYEKGASLLYDMEMELRTLAVESVQYFADGVFHTGDKERLIAHMVQLPLCFRDTVLGAEKKPATEKKGLLSPADLVQYETSSNPIEHLLRVIESYFMLQDLTYREEIMASKVNLHALSTVMLQEKLNHMRSAVKSALALKKFPTVPSYTSHQYMFIALWLALLPLTMTRQTGYFTILWAPLISYGVLGMESIAADLEDPFGHDSIDIPVDLICMRMADSIIEAVTDAQWGATHHLDSSECDANAALNPIIVGRQVHPVYSLPTVQTHEIDMASQKLSDRVLFATPHTPRMKPSLYAHFLSSVPWWSLTLITAWTVLACVISYIARRRDLSKTARWWVSFLSVSRDVATYISFAAFTLLGFFAEDAFSRYNEGGTVWGDSLRSLCNFHAGLFLKLWKKNRIHSGDHDRIIGHIAALPLVLKLELRDSRDMRQLMGLLSYADVGRMQRSSSMSFHCLDVIRTYWIKCTSTDSKNVVRTEGAVEKGVKYYFLDLEKAVKLVLFLKAFDIAPGFIKLLKTLLAMFFVVMPFVLAELTGWFTILWVPIISYGVLGMYTVGCELQNPFGNDLNDIDLDRIADEIVGDVLSIYRQQKSENGSMIEKITPREYWVTQSDSVKEIAARKLFIQRDKMTRWSKVKEAVVLAVFAVPIWELVGVLLWAATAVWIAFMVSRYLPQQGGNVLCEPWFCSAISIDSVVMKYVGFALFLLLGFRLYDSHARYESSLALVQGGLVGGLRLIVSRIFLAYPGGTWHDGDVERIAAHVAAMLVCLRGSLRQLDFGDKLRMYLQESDVRRIQDSPNPVEYCLHVVRAYIADGDRMETEEPGRHPCGIVDHYMLMRYTRKLGLPATACQRLLRIPLPFGYVQHLRIFLAIWIILLPLGLVESTGWLTILWVGFIGYGIIGIERWSQELSDPFGFDVSDIPLDDLVERSIAVLTLTLHAYREGVQPFIRADREAFLITGRVSGAEQQDIDNV